MIFLAPMNKYTADAREAILRRLQEELERENDAGPSEFDCVLAELAMDAAAEISTILRAPGVCFVMIYSNSPSRHYPQRHGTVVEVFSYTPEHGVMPHYVRQTTAKTLPSYADLVDNLEELAAKVTGRVARRS